MFCRLQTASARFSSVSGFGGCCQLRQVSVGRHPQGPSPFQNRTTLVASPFMGFKGAALFTGNLHQAMMR